MIAEIVHNLYIKQTWARSFWTFCIYFSRCYYY